MATEARTCRRPTLQVKKIDQHCSRGYCPSLHVNNSQETEQSQGFLKDSCQQKQKKKDLGSISQCITDVEMSKMQKKHQYKKDSS